MRALVPIREALVPDGQLPNFEDLALSPDELAEAWQLYAAEEGAESADRERGRQVITHLAEHAKGATLEEAWASLTDEQRLSSVESSNHDARAG